MIQDLIVDLKNFSIKKKLGEGIYGVVYLVSDNDTNELFAAKCSKIKCVEAEDQKLFFKELTAFYKTKNAAIVALKGFNLTNFDHKHYPTIFTEFMPQGSLDKQLRNNSDFFKQKKYIILLGIAEGMKYLHHQGNYSSRFKTGQCFTRR